VLIELDLWEVSLVTFPMLPDARVGSKAGEGPEDGTASRALADLACALRAASEMLRGA
jgi:phage head maturation protease